MTERASRRSAAFVVALLAVMPAFLAATLLVGHLGRHADGSLDGFGALGAGAIVALAAAALAGLVAWRASETVLMWCIGIALLASVASVAWIYLRLRQEAAVTLTAPGSPPSPQPPRSVPPP